MSYKTNLKAQTAHRANLYLDNEMSLEAEGLFKKEMQRNSETKNIVIAEQQFKRFIKNNFIQKKAPKALIQSIKNCIKEEK